jgi:hypothetical protein
MSEIKELTFYLINGKIIKYIWDFFIPEDLLNLINSDYIKKKYFRFIPINDSSIILIWEQIPFFDYNDFNVIIVDPNILEIKEQYNSKLSKIDDIQKIWRKNHGYVNVYVDFNFDFDIDFDFDFDFDNINIIAPHYVKLTDINIKNVSGYREYNNKYINQLLIPVTVNKKNPNDLYGFNTQSNISVWYYIGDDYILLEDLTGYKVFVKRTKVSLIPTNKIKIISIKKECKCMAVMIKEKDDDDLDGIITPIEGFLSYNKIITTISFLEDLHKINLN